MLARMKCCRTGYRTLSPPFIVILCRFSEFVASASWIAHVLLTEALPLRFCVGESRLCVCVCARVESRVGSVTSVPVVIAIGIIIESPVLSLSLFLRVSAEHSLSSLSHAPWFRAPVVSSHFTRESVVTRHNLVNPTLTRRQRS